jgi:c(7)-type cytochrome triheme protein
MNMQKTMINLMAALLVSATFMLVGEVYAADNPNKFNRLFVPPSDRDAALKDDGIHDPNVPGLTLLQEPREAFSTLSPGKAGNNIDWVKSLEKGQIKPHFDYRDESKEAMPMDLVIVMEVKGSMPNVAFPHKQHTVWLECANCHDAIFKPLKGSNPMSMAEIMLGQKCGVCHGSVAFPVTECRRCHSDSKSKSASKSKSK